MLKFKGTFEKLYWEDIRDKVSQLNADFAHIIDEISPNKDYWIAKVSYPYGSLVLDKSLLHIPNPNGDIVPITDDSIPTEIQDGLSYNLKSNPLSMVLDKSFELFLPLEDRTIPLTGAISAGAVFGAWRILNPGHSDHPAFLWDMTSGVRSTFLLPKITENKRHLKLKRELGLNSEVPKKLNNQWEIFREISQKATDTPWKATILYFSKEWTNKLSDEKWVNFYNYLQSKTWNGGEFWRNQPIWELIFSLILNSYEIRPNPHIIDTVHYLLHIASGTRPGFKPASNNDNGPFELIQDVYKNIYGLLWSSKTVHLVKPFFQTPMVSYTLELNAAA